MSSELQIQLAKLKQKYIDALPKKIEELADLWLQVSSVGTQEKIEELHRMAHSLAGSGATFDQIELGKLAKTLELTVKNGATDGTLFSEDNAIKINHLIKDIKKTLIDEKENLLQSSSILDSSSIVTPNVDKMKILVADDDESSRSHLAIILSNDGHEVIHARNGKEAIEVYEKNQPDVILMDAIMPIMHGYDAAKIIKNKITNKFVPVIFLTSITDNEGLAGCISAGGDDFLNKPVHPLILRAKLAAFQRISVMHAKLDEYQIKNEEEMEASKKVFDSVMKRTAHEMKGLQCWKCSPGHFSGDVRLFMEIENGDFYILLCDFTGHGLPAAIGTVFVADLFYSMSKKSIPPEAILKEINEKMHQILPTGRYCAAIMLEYSPKKKNAKLWNLGLPASYLVNKNHQIISTFVSNGIPLGVMSSASEFEFYELEILSGNSIVIFSDGITEAENHADEMYGDEELISLIEKTPAGTDLFTNIKSNVEKFMNGREPTDDISLIVLDIKDE